jgi:hypothetical protein
MLAPASHAVAISVGVNAPDAIATLRSTHTSITFTDVIGVTTN